MSKIKDLQDLIKEKSQFKSPKTNKAFKRRWDTLIGEVTGRENFKPGHLYQLEVLCDLYVEYDRLVEYLDENGYSYSQVGGRYGDQEKRRPEVDQLAKCRAEIRNYCRMLGLLLYKDTETKGNTSDDSWD